MSNHEGDQPLSNPIGSILGSEESPQPIKGKRFFRKALGKTRRCLHCNIEYTPVRRNQLTCGDMNCAKAAWKKRNRTKVNRAARERTRLARIKRKMALKEAEIDPAVLEILAEEEQHQREITPTVPMASPGVPLVEDSLRTRDLKSYIQAAYGEDGRDIVKRIHEIAFGYDPEIPIKVQLDACRELLDRGWGRPQQSLSVTPTVPVFALPESTQAAFPDMGNPRIIDVSPVPELGTNLPDMGNDEQPTEEPSE